MSKASKILKLFNEASNAGSLADFHNDLDALLTQNHIEHSLTMSYTSNRVDVKIYKGNEVTPALNLMKKLNYADVGNFRGEGSGNSMTWTIPVTPKK